MRLRFSRADDVPSRWRRRLIGIEKTSDMSFDFIILQVGLATIAFLIVLNGYLLGSKKAHIDAGLSVIWLILLGISVLAFGWRIGLLSLALSFVYGIISRPIAASISRKLLGL